MLYAIPILARHWQNMCSEIKNISVNLAVKWIFVYNQPLASWRSAASLRRTFTVVLWKWIITCIVTDNKSNIYSCGLHSCHSMDRDIFKFLFFVRVEIWSIPARFNIIFLAQWYLNIDIHNFKLLFYLLVKIYCYFKVIISGFVLNDVQIRISCF